MADIPKFPDIPEGTPRSNFVHLHVHSDYSLLDGASKITTLAKKAHELNMPALALTDHGNMFGVLNFEHVCHANGINPVVGEEFYVAYGSHTERNDVPYSSKKAHYFHLILLCKNEAGYKNMSWLSSIAFTEGLYYGKPRIDFELLKKYHEGLICLSACIQGELPQLLLAGKDAEAERLALEYRDLFGAENYYIELQNHGLPEQVEVAAKLIRLAKKLGIPTVLTNDVHYCDKDDAEAQDALRCIGFKKKLDEPHQTMGEGRTEWYLKSEQEMASVLRGVEGADDALIAESMANTLKIASMCDLTIHQYKTQELKDCLPRFELPPEFRRHEDYAKNQDDYVRHLVEKGLERRYGAITDEIRKRAEYELGVIFSMGFSGYFLIVWEFINWSRENGIPIGPGRGSGAGSLVAYCMGITDIDPFRFGLIFERFLNPERVSMPDFDIDMDFDFRQDIIEHTRKTYGDAQVGHIVTFGTLKPKNCIADVGRILGIPLAEVNALKKCIPDNPKAKLKDAFSAPDAKHPDNGQLIPYKDDPRYQRLFSLCFKLEGLIRNTGLHASGMVIGLTPLPDWAPIFKDAKTGEVAVQYTMDIIEPCGLVKFDYLGLKTLSLIRYAENIVNKHRKPGEPEFKTENMSDTDAETFEMFSRGDSVAIFQFESPGMQKILRQAKPRRLEELVALNALYRPGPMDYIPQYIDGKWKPETVHYPDPCLEDLLKETYGVMVYQEQVMQVSQRIAGFSLGGADMLRRAMGKKKPEVLMGKKKEFIEGAVRLGFTEQHAADIFEIMIPFAGYGFNKSHAAAYTVLAYRTGWLKCHKPAEFMAANLTNEINSTDKLPEYIEEARSMGIPVDPPDVNRSDAIFDVVDGHIVFGLKGIKGMGDNAANEIVSEREKNGAYKSFMDFLQRVDLRSVNKRAVEVLIKTGAFDKLGQNRPTLSANMDKALAFAESEKEEKNAGQLSLFEDAGMDEQQQFKFEVLPDIPRMEKLEIEKEFIGCYVSGHPLDDYRDVMERCATVNSATIMRTAQQEKALKEAQLAAASDWKAKKSVRDSGRTHVAVGMFSGLRTIRTKNGDEMAFGRITDLCGDMDVTFFPKVWERIGAQIHNDAVFAFKGRTDLQDGRDSPSFLVESVEDIATLAEKKLSEVHVQVRGSDKAEISRLKEFLLDLPEAQGGCALFIHLADSGRDWIIRASSGIKVPSSKEFLGRLAEFGAVGEVWAA